MGIRDWFNRRKMDEPRLVGKSAGGSRLYKYDGDEFHNPTFGFTEDNMLKLVRRREEAYDALFGHSDSVFHEVMPMVPHIDVYWYRPSGPRTFETYVTSGMSDLPQSSPPEFGKETRRVELIFYAAQPDELYFNMLRRLAHFPHDNNTWLHWGHTMPNGNPPQPLFGEPPLDTMLFMHSIVHPDADLPKRLSWQGELISFLWCVPITTAECQFKLEHGADALYDIFDKVNHPVAFSGNRASYV